MRKLMSFLSGAMIGGLVGAAVGLLFTPASGEDLRTQVSTQIQRVQEEMKLAASTRRAELEAQLADLRAGVDPETPQT
jgi:gas vesicle protein